MTQLSVKLLGELSKHLGRRNVLLGPDISERYHVDWSGINSRPPLAVLKPATTDDVAFIMAKCHEAAQRVVVQGGMTGLCSGATPQVDEIALSLERMSAIEDIDPLSMTMTVLAGTPLEKIQDSARQAGLLFPLDLGARGSCTIGGNISTNAGGTQVISFGMTRNLILGIEAVLPDGTVLTSLNKMLKNNAGFDLKHLFIGTEGTLGIVTRAVLRLFPVPLTKSTALCALSSLPDAIQLLQDVRKRLGNGLTTFEVMWSDYMDYALQNVHELTCPFERRFAIYVLLEFEGVQPEVDSVLFEEVLLALMEDGLIRDAVIAKSEREAAHLWRLRDAIGEILQRLRHAINFDISAPIRAIPEMLDLVSYEMRKAFKGYTQLTYGHLGDSNIHLTITTGRESDIEHISEVVYSVTSNFDGSISGEHGIGVTKQQYLTMSRRADEIDLMRKLKVLIDPKGILNRNRVIPQ